MYRKRVLFALMAALLLVSMLLASCGKPKEAKVGGKLEIFSW